MQYNKWEENVKKSTEELKIRLDENQKCKELYNGFYIWDSKFVENPEIMFIGINPGDGNPNNDKSITVEPAWQMSYLEYLDGENPTYTLARENVKIFELLGLKKDEIKRFLMNVLLKLICIM